MVRQKIGRKERENRIKFFTYISPWLIGLSLFTIVPMILSVIYSFTDVKMTTVNSDPLNFIQFDNYIYIFTEDKDFQQAILNTFVYAIIKVALIVLLALLFALVLNRKIFGRKTFRIMLYLPAVNFFATGVSSMGTLIFVGVWSGLGPTMLIILAAIQGVSQELIEASQLDGANAFQRLIHITLPSISKAMVFVVLTSMISALQAYAEVELLTAGGPGNSTMTMSLLIVQNAFKTLGKKTLGYACAQGWVVFLMTFGLALIYVILSTKKEKEGAR